MKVIIKVEGGLVQAIYTDDPRHISVKIWDCDISDFATGAEIENQILLREKMEAIIPTMTQIY